jgi:hypothetical protein
VLRSRDAQPRQFRARTIQRETLDLGSTQINANTNSISQSFS